MRYLLYIAAVAILCGSSSCSSAEEHDDSGNDAPKRHGWDGKLHGDVDSVTINIYDLEDRFGELHRSLTSTEVVKFNDEGNVSDVRYTSVDEEYGACYTCIYEYDDNGYSISTYDSEGKLSSKSINNVDDRGNVTTHSLYDEDGGLKERTIATYDNDMISVFTVYNSEGNMTMRCCYEVEGRDIVGMIQYDEDGDVNYKYTIDRNGDGLEWYVRNIDDDGEVFHSTRICYKAPDMIDEVIEYDADSIMTSWSTYIYDDRNNLIKIETFTGGARIPKSCTEYAIAYRK